MTSDQAAQLIQQNSQILDVLHQVLPLLGVLLHDVFPAVAIGFALWLGVVLGTAATP